MIPITVIPIILAIAVIPPVLTSDSDPIDFIQGIIPSIQVACAQLDLCTFDIGQCFDNGCEAAGGTCVLLELGPVNDVNLCSCEFPSVGGWFLQVDKPSLLLAGSQMTASWLIPVIVSAIGIGIVIARKF